MVGSKLLESWSDPQFPRIHPSPWRGIIDQVRGKLSLVLICAVGLLAAPVAVGAATPPQPLQVVSASLSQLGRDLTWTVTTAGRLSPAQLARQHRTLCLLVRPGSARSFGQVCLAAARRSGRPRLFFSAPGGSSRIGKPIDAAISRSSSSQLTASFAPSAVGLSYHRSLRWQVLSTVSRTETTFPARPKLLKLHVPRLVGCVPRGPSKVFAGPARAHDIALTFDDGPSPDPPAMDFVKLLARRHVPATFFEIGNQIPQFDPSGSAERAMLADGDMIGDHTWTHPQMTHLSPSAQRSELERTIHAIGKRTGFTPCLWRPPYGDVNARLVSLARSLGLLTTMWDVDPADWSLPGTATISRRVTSAAHNGAIVIQHFGGGPRYETLAALPKEIATLRKRGYRFVTVAQLLGLQMIYR